MTVEVHPWGRSNLIIGVAFGVLCLGGAAIVAFDFSLCMLSWLRVVQQPSKLVTVVSDDDSVDEAWQRTLQTGAPLRLAVVHPDNATARLTSCSIGPPSRGITGLFAGSSNEPVGVWLDYWDKGPNEVRMADEIVVFRWWLPARYLAFTLGIWLAIVGVGIGILWHNWKMWRSGATQFEMDMHSHWGEVTACCSAIVAAGMTTQLWLIAQDESAFQAVAAEVAGGVAAVIVLVAVWLVSRMVRLPSLLLHNR